MADYEIVFARSARKELQALDYPVAVRILKRIESLGVEPRPSGVRKLEGALDLCALELATGESFIASLIMSGSST